MDIPVVISHKSAWRLFHAPNLEDVQRGKKSYGIKEPGLKACEVVKRVKQALTDCGVEAEHLGTIDILVPFPSQRCRSRGLRSHVLGRPIPGAMVTRITDGLFVVNPGVSFVQAAGWLDQLELIEYGYELCGGYAMPIASDAKGTSGYRERKALTNVETIQESMQELAGAHGLKKARGALGFVRDGSRSPMETALALMVVLPKAQGGLGYADIQMNHRIDVPQRLRKTSSSRYLELDLFSPSERVAIEYDGIEHSKLGRRTHDADRAGTLGLLGIRVRTITSQHFARKLEMHRALNGIATMLGIRPETSVEFQERQDELRKWVTRRWANEKVGQFSTGNPSK